ncbi:MAG: alanine--glyoxylate aminotransferase [Spirochaetae bacterium HGW-Spirochaetae-4]|nr:MAG: alanine--glyoxylate aminotransferase [Spirochaetae bacterium HGW-Spirochaetae-4]
MNNKLHSIKEILLMGPGPSLPYPEVYDALGTPTLGHLDPKFIEIMDDIKAMLKVVFNTESDVIIPVSGTGSCGMEAALVNLIEPGDSVLVLENGVFGQRQYEIASRLHADVDILSFPWGTAVVPDEVEKALSKKKYKIVSMVHAETSTGVCNPAGAIGELTHSHGCCYILDTVTSLGGIPVEIDKWHVDASYSGTQKCLACPPGLSPLVLSSKAMEIIRSRKTKIPNWYLDMNLITQYWGGKQRAYHHTAPINMLYGLYQSLLLVTEETLAAVYKRHLDAHKFLVDELKELGLDMVVEEAYRLPMLNSIWIPSGVDDKSIRSRLLNEFFIEIGAGLGKFSGKVWRIGLMGNTARKENVSKLIRALHEVLK